MAQDTRTSLVEEPAEASTALLIVDMISDWKVPGMQDLLKAAHAIAPNLARLKRRCEAAGVPVIYVNDNMGRWRSDFKSLVKAAQDEGGMAADIAHLLAPDEHDYFVLKPKHSAFFRTPLDLLLEHLKVDHLIMAGVSSDQCIHATAMDAQMRDHSFEIVRDGIAAPTPERTAAAIRVFEHVMNKPVVPGDDIELPA